MAASDESASKLYSSLRQLALLSRSDTLYIPSILELANATYCIEQLHQHMEICAYISTSSSGHSLAFIAQSALQSAMIVFE
jgi:hypothetical protein